MERGKEGDAAFRSSAQERSLSPGISQNRIGPAAGVSPQARPVSPSSYEEIPYESEGIAETHPNHMAAIAALFGIEAPDPARCRLLELGCARGDNVMAVATTLAGASFLGIDGSPRQISDGERRRAGAGLDNVRLLAADFTSIPEDLGEFDYVVCHGVYSWVPPETADLLLRLCRRHLTPGGIAYVSYNTYPGWHRKEMLRDMMGFHVRSLTRTSEKIEQARAVLQFLARFAREEGGTHRAVFEMLARELAGAEDSHVFHDYLEEYNCPIYFTEFAERAAAAGLQYVGSASAAAWDNNLPEEVASALGQLENRIVREQYLDYLCNRTFRRSLLSRAGVPRSELPDAGAVRALFATANAWPARAEPDVASDGPEEFVTHTGVRVTTNRPLMKAALAALARRAPGFLTFEELWEETRVLAGKGASEASPQDLAPILLRCCLSGFLRLSLRPPPFSIRPSGRPRASALARIQAAEDPRVTTLHHRTLRLEDVDRFVLSHCDGTRDRGDLVRILISAVEREEFSLNDSDGLPVRDSERRRVFGGEAIEASLERLAEKALLME
ncbi:MAG: class I SAM-dependent methyltransferase [Acidobacteriota bacterium]|nr:class I SAM-dependent methyltransferase [Acidobacteriota bacterium]